MENSANSRMTEIAKPNYHKGETLVLIAKQIVTQNDDKKYLYLSNP